MEKKHLAEILEATSITLKKAQPEMAQDNYQLVDSDRERLKQFLDWPDKVNSVEDQKKWLEECLKSWDSYTRAPFGIFKNQQLIGIIEAFDLNWDHHSCEIGYWLVGNHEGKGYMSDAVKVLENELYEIGFNRIVISTNPANTRSSAIPKRLGYSYEGTQRQVHYLDPKYEDLEVFSKLRSEWTK